MENSELSIPVPPAQVPPPASYPSANPQNPFGELPRDRPKGPAWSAGPSPSKQRRTLRERIGGALAAIVALIAKFFSAIKGLIFLLPKATALTAIVSVAAYSLWFGWWFAVGFVLLLFVHEMGHVFALRREGIKASAPMFIPFMGAVITSKSLGENALAEARVGLAGPVLGTVGAAVCLVIGEVTNSDFFRALAYIGFFLNLFNLLPIVPLDGGRAMAAMAPWMWFVGFGVLVALALLFPNPIIWFIVLFAGYELYRRWQARKSGSIAQAAYYRVAPRHRLLVGAVYIGLIVLLVFGMEQSHILSSGGHSFRSL